MEMRFFRAIGLFPLGLLFTHPALAGETSERTSSISQDAMVPWEVSALFSYTGDELGTPTFGGPNIQPLGLGLRATRNLNNWFGLEVQTIVIPASNEDAFRVALGPRFTFLRGLGSSAFFHNLSILGYSHAGGFRDQPYQSGLFREFAPALDFGGGIGYALRGPYGLRFDIGDYVTFPRNRWAPSMHHFDTKVSFLYRF
jgi:hypothetical protein